MSFKIHYLFIFLFIFSVISMLPYEATADVDHDSMKILLLQKEMENDDYLGNSDSICEIKIQELKKLLDDFQTKHEPNKPYIRGKLYYAHHLMKSQPHQSLLLLHQMDSVCTEMGFDSLKAFISHDIGSVYFQNGLIPEALKLFAESALYFDKIGDKAAYGYALIDIGNVYYRQEQFSNSLAYYRKAEKIFKKLDKDYDRAWGTSLVNHNYGEIYFRINQLDSSIFFYKKALNIRIKNDLKGVISTSYIAIALVYSKDNNYDSALYYANQAVDIDTKNNLSGELSLSLYHYAKILSEIDTIGAIKYIHKSISVNKGNPLSVLLYDYSLLSKLYKNANVDSSLYYSKLIFDISSKIDSRYFIRIAINNLINIYHLKKNYKEEAKYLRVKVEQNRAKYDNETYRTELKIKEKQWTQERELWEAKNKKEKVIGYFQWAIVALIFGFSIYLFYSRIKINRYALNLKKINDKLNEVNKNRDTIYSIIAHDLRGPVGSSLSLIDLIDNDDMELESYRMALPTIKKSLKGTYNLLENLLSWAHLNRHDIILKFKKLNLKKLANDIEYLLRETANNKEIEIIVQIEDNIEIYADQNSISTVLRNLISNAIKFSNMYGKIILEAKDFGDTIEISVMDFGLGMKEEITRKIFFTEDTITTAGTQNEQGSGLGLKLCKEFVALNNGKIWVKSELGKGSTFYFTLPKAKDSLIS